MEAKRPVKRLLQQYGRDDGGLGEDDSNAEKKR